MKLRLNDLDDLVAFANSFVKMQRGIIGLSGELGAGKTTFVRACVSHIAAQSQVQTPRVTSPSFVLHQSYRLPKCPVEHFDLYRLDQLSPSQLEEIGYQDATNRTRQSLGLLFVEWPEQARERKSLQLDVLLTFQIEADGGRTIVYHPV